MAESLDCQALQVCSATGRAMALRGGSYVEWRGISESRIALQVKDGWIRWCPWCHGVHCLVLGTWQYATWILHGICLGLGRVLQCVAAGIFWTAGPQRSKLAMAARRPATRLATRLRGEANALADLPKLVGHRWSFHASWGSFIMTLCSG